MSKKFFKFLQLMGLFSLSLLVACAPVAATPSDEMIQTIVAATLEAMPTSTQLPTQTASPEPSETPEATATQAETATPEASATSLATITPLATASIQPPATSTRAPTLASGGGGGVIATRTPTNPNYSCIILSQNPANYLEFKSGDDVTVTWQFSNVGLRDWEKENIDIGYISGQKMAIGGTLFDLPQTIRSGQVGEVELTFEAPDKEGTYVTNWALFHGTTPFCWFSFSLVVK